MHVKLNHLKYAPKWTEILVDKRAQVQTSQLSLYTYCSVGLLWHHISAKGLSLGGSRDTCTTSASE